MKRKINLLAKLLIVAFVAFLFVFLFLGIFGEEGVKMIRVFFRGEKEEFLPKDTGATDMKTIPIRKIPKKSPDLIPKKSRICPNQTAFIL
ncbi:MAG: hypothetical protein WC158_03195, partial [Candidatus Paceibacterota bacterium]